MVVTATSISSRANVKVKQLRAAFAGNMRLSQGLIAIEGEHLFEEALRSGITLKSVFISGSFSSSLTLPKGAEVVRLTEDVFASAVETRSPQGIAALIEPPIHRLEDILQQPNPLILVAEGLQDPGNLGTLARSAEAFGAAGLLATPGTVSIWNQKALRASVGSAFRLPVLSVARHQIEQFPKHGIRLLAAVGSEGPGVTAAQDTDLATACAIMIGNEGSGLSPEWITLSTSLVAIPCPGPVESLNAAIAGSLLLYEASRQRTASARSVERIPGPLRRRPTGAAR